ncbi:MAG: TOBE domain-containing protein [Desulfovibrio sp.]|jgi:molybdate transport system regulatory protein|nr:TOBE domain-containing protein [Desulfovibrio sp.]
MSRDNLTFRAQDEEILDSAQLDALERCFRSWARETVSWASRISRLRILLVFLLIRYTGAKLKEVLSLNPPLDIDANARTVTYRSGENGQLRRQTAVSQRMAGEIEELLQTVRGEPDRFFAVDPAYVRKKFYERAEQCGFCKKSGGPEMLRKARAVEMLHNVPVPAVQHLLGHSSPNQTTSYVSFSREDMREATRLYMEMESGCHTSARNSFCGKVISLAVNEIQTLVELLTPAGDRIFSIITNSSSERLDLELGTLAVAEVKSTWLGLERCDRPGVSSAENQLEGVATKVISGGITVECVVTLKDGTELCSLLTAGGFSRLGIGAGDQVRVLFGACAVILRAD